MVFRNITFFLQMDLIGLWQTIPNNDDDILNLPYIITMS